MAKISQGNGPFIRAIKLLNETLKSQWRF